MLIINAKFSVLFLNKHEHIVGTFKEDGKAVSLV